MSKHMLEGWEIVKCTCGSKYCNIYGTSNGIFYQGSGYTLEDARLIVSAPRLYNRLLTTNRILNIYLKEYDISEGARMTIGAIIECNEQAIAKAEGEE